MKSIIESRIKEIDVKISKFKTDAKDSTEWDTGYDIRDYIDTYLGVEYGKLLGHRDCLKEFLHLINNTPTIDGENKLNGGSYNAKEIQK